MTLMQSWANSLALFKPKNLKPFAMVTALAIGKLYQTIWPFLVVSQLALLFLGYAGRYFIELYKPSLASLMYSCTVIGFISTIIFAIIYSVIFLAARPSAERKNLRYFVHYLATALPLALTIGILNLIALVKMRLFTKLIFALNMPFVGFIFFAILLPISLLIFALFLYLFTFFYLDGRKTFLGLWRTGVRAATMLIYNLPLFFILIVGHALLTYAIKMLIPLLPLPQLSYRYLLLEPCFIALIANVYTTRLHSQPSLYVKEAP